MTPFILIALFLIWLLIESARSSPIRSTLADGVYKNEPRGIDCLRECEGLPGDFIRVIRQPPDVGANVLVTNSLAHTFAHILLGVLPRQSLKEQYRAHFDVQLSYALLPGRRQVYKFDIRPDCFQEEVSQILDAIFERLPALPLDGGSLFLACRFRINRISSGCPDFPRPYAGLIDGDSQLSWETQLEQVLARSSTAIDNSGIAPDDCRRLLELAPDNGHAHWLLGALYRLRGEPERALESFSKLVALNDWQHARLPRAEILMGLGRVAEALAEVDALLAHVPDHLAALILRADALRLAGDFPVAEQAADRAIELGPWHSGAYLARAQIDAALQKHQSAAGQATTAHFCCPADPVPVLFRAEQYAILGDLDSALVDLKKLDSQAPGWLPALQLQAQVLFAAGKFEPAVNVLNEVLNHFPHERPLLLRGRALGATGKLESAHVDFTRVLELNGENGEALLYRAQVSFELGRFEEASADVSRAIACKASPVEAHFLRGMIAVRQENADDAMEAFDQVLAINPVDQRALIERGQLCLAQENAAGALPDGELAVTTYPESAAAWCLRGEARRQLGDVAAAIEDFDESLACDAQFVAARFGRAKALSDRGDSRGALLDLDLVIERHPDWPDPRWFRANVLLKQGAGEPAIIDLRYLRRQAQANPLPTQILEAQALLNCERFNEVIPLCEEILEADSDFWLAWIWLGFAHFHSGEPDRGRESFERALELQPGQATVIAVQQALAAAAYHQRREEFDEVIRIATQILDDDSASIAARHQRASAYWYSQHLVEAAEDFSAIVQDHPECTSARSGRGQVLAELGDIDAALLDLNQSISELENSGSAAVLAYTLSGRALTWIAQEQFESADADLDRSLLLEPLNAWSMYHRGLRYHADGQPQAAGICFRLALVLNEPALPPHKRAKAQAYAAARAR